MRQRSCAGGPNGAFQFNREVSGVRAITLDRGSSGRQFRVSYLEIKLAVAMLTLNGLACQGSLKLS
jgi:hypothetical protein